MTSPAETRIEALLPCTAAQVAMAEASQGSGQYLQQSVLRVSGSLKPDRLRRAWEQTQHHHQVTRLTLHRHEDRWIQVLRTEPHAETWAVHDLRGTPPAQRELIAGELVRRAGQTLDMRAGPLLRLDLLIEGDTAALLVLSHHHAVADGTTVELLLRSLADAYAGRLDVPRLDLVSATRRLWADTGDDPLTEFAADIADMPMLLPTWPPPTGPSELITEQRGVKPDITRVRRDAATHGTTPAAVTQAALLAVLAHGRGEPAACLSLAVDLRALVPGALHTGGLFLTTLPITARVGPADTGLTLAAQLARRAGPRRLHPGVSLPQTLMAASEAGRQGVPDTLLTVQRSTALPDPPPGLSWCRAWTTEHTEFALNLDAVWTDEVMLRAQFDLARVPAGHVAGLLDRTVAVLSEPSRPVAELLGEPGWLRAAGIGPEADSSDSADLLARVLAAVRRVTREPVGPDEDLLRAGHSSLTLMSIVVDLAEHGIPCTVGTLLDRPTARGAAAYAERRQPGDTSTTTTFLSPSSFTPLEKSLLARTDRTDWGTQPMHEQSVLTFAEVLTPSVARRAWQKVIERYPALGRDWSQTAAPSAPELTTRSDTDTHQAARDWLTAQLGIPFRPNAPLMRAALFVGARDSSLALAFHNALIDGWSFPTLIRELQRAYAALATGDEPPAPLGDDGRTYRRWLGGRRDGDDAKFWARALDGSAFPPHDGPSPSRERAVARRREVLSHLTAVSTAAGTTPNMVAAALVSTAFTEATARPPHEPLGLRVSARPPELPGAMRMVGQFTAELPMPRFAGPSQRWPEATRRLAASIEAARRHSHLGEAGIRSAAACPPESDLYRDLLVVEEYLPFDEWASQAGPGAWTLRSQWRREVSPSRRTLYVEPTVDGYDLVLSTAVDEDPGDLLAAIAARTRAALDAWARPVSTAFGLVPALTAVP
ncbi:condensation domain-containing protein [Streptomyces echinatus]|uniref:Aryl carrier-like protein n=1 Tax=Streptomyces echinatus TaxID=67293 RepID=A0A7W9PRF0_9ACTN|nr:condensation domain-containing protein [Streptomyces echinatus]MBB5926575.1 aryl carrier-like protein [Streptomyces echinatus]